ncbi:hypothetical protein SFRURICE_003895 [Spodoptera frugiperda]|nr:hypothetical protein SFRURICE_003895 [Spodoptera frugiperda]
MAKENLNVNGEVEECTVVPIVGDGACLFRALSYLMYGTQDRAMEVRTEIVKYVVNDWSKFSIMTHDRNGDNYVTPDEYFGDMMKNATYGGLCELIAAGLIFPFKFEVYRNGLIYTESGSNDYPRQAVATYQTAHPKKHRQAVATYQASHLDKHRQAVATYQASHPDKHRQSVATYQAANPEKHRQAASLYQARNTDVHRIYGGLLAELMHYVMMLKGGRARTAVFLLLDKLSPKFPLSDEIILQSSNISESLTWCSSISGWTSDEGQLTPKERRRAAERSDPLGREGARIPVTAREVAGMREKSRDTARHLEPARDEFTGRSMRSSLSIKLEETCVYAVKMSILDLIIIAHIKEEKEAEDIRRERFKRKRNFWVHDVWKKRHLFGQFHWLFPLKKDYRSASDLGLILIVSSGYSEEGDMVVLFPVADKSNSAVSRVMLPPVSSAKAVRWIKRSGFIAATVAVVTMITANVAVKGDTQFILFFINDVNNAHISIFHIFGRNTH